MAKTCPSCGYSPIGPFTDNCPVCAEPVRNVRSDDAGGFGRSWNMPSWLRWTLGGALVAVLGVGGCCGLGLWRLSTAIQTGIQDAQKAAELERAKAEADRIARTVVVTAAKLSQEFEKDPAAAEKKYLGQYLEISGVVERVGTGRGGNPFVVVYGGDEEAKVKIECFFYPANEREDARIKRLEKGRAITVRGEYDGRVSNVQVRECVLVK